MVNLKPALKLKLLDKAPAFFTGKLGVCFNLLSVQCCGGVVACQELSDCFRPVGPRNVTSQSPELGGQCVSCVRFPAWQAHGRNTEAGHLPVGLGGTVGLVREQGVPTSTSRSKGECKNGTCQHLHPCRESQQASVPLADALRLANRSPSYLVEVLYKLVLLQWVPG